MSWFNDFLLVVFLDLLDWHSFCTFVPADILLNIYVCLEICLLLLELVGQQVVCVCVCVCVWNNYQIGANKGNGCIQSRNEKNKQANVDDLLLGCLGVFIDEWCENTELQQKQFYTLY